MLFHSYVGAVYATQGMTAVQAWIGPLVDPEFDGSTPMDADSDPLYNNVNNAKKFKQEQESFASMRATVAGLEA